MILILSAIASQVSGQINCPPNLPLTLMGNTEYCIGTPGSQLSVDQLYAGYEWLPTVETGQNVLLTAGNYQVVVTHYTGCTDTLEFEVEQVSNPPQPTITADGPTQFCAGGSVILTATEGYPFYEWNSGSISDEITVFETGTYVVSIEDWNGCVSSSNSLQVTVDPLPVAAFSPNLNMYEIEFNNLSENATAYEWSFGDGNSSTDFEPTHTYSIAGSTSMWLVASNDCGTDTAFLELMSVGLDKVEELSEINLYPNPNAGVFTLSLSSSNESTVDVSLLDELGRSVTESKIKLVVGSNQLKFEFDDVSAGLYFFEVRSNQSTLTKRLVIQH
ncbi:MAG: T9SS type A sorting domain-containing protein [Flavobacteriales bacterium]|nr:T9SS type A sorting domain-containing protein [Flavobacteriales bacterium]